MCKGTRGLVLISGETSSTPDRPDLRQVTLLPLQGHTDAVR
jgi:hypothetical protein